jgi:hypothetical protein
MAEYADRIANDNFDKPQSVFESCVGKFVDRSDQLWIIDVDKEDCDKLGCNTDDLVSYYKHIIEDECEPKKHIVKIIPTKTGRHIICHPFNVEKFVTIVNSKLHGEQSCVETESLIKKNNFTLLYENIK